MDEKVKKQANKQNLTLVKDCKEKFNQEEKFFIKEAIISVLSEIIVNDRQDDDIDDSILYYGKQESVNYQYYNYLQRKKDALNKLYKIFDK